MSDVYRTLVLRVKEKVPARLEHYLELRGKEAARWANRAMHLLYADKRNNGWRTWGPKGAAPLAEEKRDGTYKVNARAMYKVFIKVDSPHSIPSSILKAIDKQALLEKVALAWQNFLVPPRGIKRPHAKKGRPALPQFTSLIRFSSTDEPLWNTSSGLALHLRIPEEYASGMDDLQLVSPSQESAQRSFDEYIRPLYAHLSSGADGKKVGVAVELHEQGKHWYAHIAVPIEVPTPPQEPQVVMGVDRGVRNLLTAAIVTDDKTEPIAVRNVSAASLLHRLKRVEARMSRLHSLKSRGHSAAGVTLRRLKGEHSRLQKTYSRMAAADLVNIAVNEGIEGVALEDLSEFKSKRRGRRLNRRIGLWPRRLTLDAIQGQCEKRGLGFVEVYPDGTSTICPKCRLNRKKNRNTRRRIFACRGCGYITPDTDIVGATNIARRGWRYWHSPKRASSSPSSPQAGMIGQDCGGSFTVGESRMEAHPHLPGVEPVLPSSPHSKPGDGQGPATDGNIGVSAERAEKQTNGPIMGRLAAAGSGHLSGERAPGTINAPADKNATTISKTREHSSGPVPFPLPGGARTDVRLPRQVTIERWTGGERPGALARAPSAPSKRT